MSYRFTDHTAELQLELESPTRAGVFEDAVLALSELLGGESLHETASVEREVEVSAADAASLLAEWVDEIVFVAETGGLVPRRVERLDLEPSSIRATISFSEGVPTPLVKGATYHDLRLENVGGVWRGRVVLDV